MKQKADYEACDPSRLDDWLTGISPEFRQYTYQMIKSGVDKAVLRFLNEEHLERDCGVLNGIHRLKMLEAAKRESFNFMSSSRCSLFGFGVVRLFRNNSGSCSGSNLVIQGSSMVLRL